MFGQKQPLYNQRQIDSAIHKRGLKDGEKAIASAFKSAGMDSGTSKQVAATIVRGPKHQASEPRSSLRNTEARGIKVTGSVKSGTLASGAGVRVSRQYNTGSGESHTKVRDSWSKNPSASVEISVPVINTPNANMEIRSRFEKERGKKPEMEMRLNTNWRF